jgi:alkylhydroperoxidase family enzyme
MARMRKVTLLGAFLAAACAAPGAPRDPDASKQGIERVKEREPFLPMLSDADARKAMGGFQGKRAPNLARVAAHMPKTFQAEMAAWGALGKEGTIDRRLMSEVFYVVSSANDCFY